MCIFHLYQCMRNERVQYNVSGCTITSAARNQITNVIVHLRKGRIAFVRALASPRTANTKNKFAPSLHIDANSCDKVSSSQGVIKAPALAGARQLSLHVYFGMFARRVVHKVHQRSLSCTFWE